MNALAVSVPQPQPDDENYLTDIITQSSNRNSTAVVPSQIGPMMPSEQELPAVEDPTEIVEVDFVLDAEEWQSNDNEINRRRRNYAMEVVKN